MPHAEIKYSSDLKIDFEQLFTAIEKVINDHDSSAGVCKGRAYPAKDYLHSHILVTISMLTKSHRTKEFTQKLSEDLEKEIKKYLKQNCYFSFLLEYNPDHYITSQHIIS